MYVPKFYNTDTIEIDNPFDLEEKVNYTNIHNMKVRYQNGSGSCSDLHVINEFQKSGFSYKIFEEPCVYQGLTLDPYIVVEFWKEV